MVSFEGLDILRVLTQIKCGQDRYLAMLLTDIEQNVDPEVFPIVRKLVLDHFNDYTRSIFRLLIGEDIEGLIFR